MLPEWFYKAKSVEALVMTVVSATLAVVLGVAVMSEVRSMADRIEAVFEHGR